MWLVWRPGSPDPSRPSPAIHFEDPAKDRKDLSKAEPLAVLPIAPEHRGLPLAELTTLSAYASPGLANV